MLGFPLLNFFLLFLAALRISGALNGRIEISSNHWLGWQSNSFLSFDGDASDLFRHINRFLWLDSVFLKEFRHSLLRDYYVLGFFYNGLVVW